MRFRAEELAEMATRVNEILAGKEDGPWKATIGFHG